MLCIINLCTRPTAYEVLRAADKLRRDTSRVKLVANILCRLVRKGRSLVYYPYY